MARGEVRKEHDGMGALDVPADALWGAQTQRAIDNFRISGLALPRRFLEALGLVKWAAARANGDVAGLDPRLAEAIGDSALEVSSGQHDGQFPVDVFQTGSGTSTNMNANEVIATLAGRRCGLPVHPNDHVNMSQSSNDVVPTTIHVAAALGIKGHLVPAFATLRAAIDARVHDIGHVPKTGRTHLMDAVPLTLGQELGGWRQQIDNAIERVRACEPRLHRLALGGTAVGTGLNAPHAPSNCLPDAPGCRS
jgi:fumarate hydratase class II